VSASRLLIDEENPWPGLGSFDEPAARFFNGRRQESVELRRLVLQAPLTVLFGKSGLGKTSLVQAGLFPLLRKENVLPVYVRLDVRDRGAPLVSQVRRALLADLQAHRVDAPGLGAGESLWEYLHRSELWSEQNQLLTPLFVFDQFEEVFTLGAENPEGVAQLRVDLADLIENRIPAPLGARIEESETAAEGLALQAQRYKVLVSFREDFLPAVEGWKRELPSILRNRLRLLPMSGEQAFEAIHTTAPHLVDEEVAREIVRFVAAAQEERPAAAYTAAGTTELEVEPALLSLVCHGLNEKRKAQGKPAFDRALLHGAGQAIISDYYQSAVGDMPERVQRFIENELITERGFRKPCDAGDARAVHGLTDSELRLLVDRRLLRIEPYQGTDRVELTHDLLTRVVREHRDRERERQRIRRQRKRMVLLGSGAAVLLLIVAVLAGLSWIAFDRALQADLEAKEAERQKRLAKTSEKQALAAKDQAVKALARAERERRRAEILGVEAEESASKALAAADAEAAQRELAEEQRRQATARKLIAQAEAELEGEDEGLGRSSLLAIESLKAAWTPDAHELLVRQNALLPPRPLKAWKAHDSAVTALASSRRWLATESETGAAVWDIATGNLVARLPNRHPPVYDDIALSPDERWLVAPCEDLVCVWDTGSWDAPKLKLSRYLHAGLRFSPDSRRLSVAAYGQGTVDIYETSGWQKVGELQHDAKAAAWSPDGHWLVTSAYGSMKLWDSRLLEQRAEEKADLAWNLAFDQKGTLLQDLNGVLVLWEIDQEEAGAPRLSRKTDLRVRERAGLSVRHGLVQSPGGDHFATTWGIYAADSGQERSRMPAGVNSLAFLSGGRELVVGFQNGNVAIWPFDAKEVRRLPHESPVSSVAFSPDTRWLATASDDGIVRVFDTRNWREVRGLEHGAEVDSVSFSPRGRWLVTIAGGSVSVFAVDGWRRVARIDHDGETRGLAFTQDEMRLFTRAGTGVGVVDLGGEVRSRLLKHPDRVEAVYVSRDGGWFKTVTEKEFSRGLGVTTPTKSFLWDARNGKLLAWRSHGQEDLKALGGYGLGPRYEVEAAEGDPQLLLRLAWDGDGWSEIAADRELRFQKTPWAVASTAKGKDLLSTYLDRAGEAHHGRMVDHSLSSDGRWLATAGRDATVRLWPLRAEELIELACSRLPQNFSAEEWKQLQVDDGPLRKTCPGLP
jgi:WD40 repeat protein